MNRRKKLTQQFKKKEKAKNAKLNTKKKPAYISKAERARNETLDHLALNNTCSTKAT